VKDILVHKESVMTQYRKSLAVLLAMTVIYPTLSIAETSNESTKKLSIEERLLRQEQLILQLQERILEMESSRVVSNKTSDESTPKSLSKEPKYSDTKKATKSTQILSKKAVEPKKSISNKKSFSSKKPISSYDKPIAVKEKVLDRYKEESKEVSLEPTLSLEDHLATKEKTKILSESELVSDEFLGSWPMFGTDMRMKIGGYVKGDVIYDFDGTLDKHQFLMSTIPVEGTADYGNDGYTAITAKETRLNLDVRKV
jgi:hypothetical protein